MLTLLFAVLPFAVLGVAITIALSQMFDRVNHQLPEGEQIEFFGRWPGKVSRVRRLYREYYPDGRLARWEIVLEVAAGLWAAFAIWLLR
jgi:hypothetical protein